MKTRTIKLLKRLAAVVLFAPVLAMASTAMHLDKAPVSPDPQNLQRGAELFIQNCLNCHSASMLRYSELKKIGFDEKTITEKLIYTGGKIGDLMTIAMTRDDAEAWFGTAPPDLSLMARAKGSEFGSGADYLYTYLRGFYKDENRPTGWNNKVFDNVGMPHALWNLQSEQPAEQYDKDVADLVSFMVWMGEPDAGLRKKIGIFVIIFLAGFYVLTHKLGKTYWKNIH
jgi:ubiquinol-cytochrome c reductase cytochrome c1 subunit